MGVMMFVVTVYGLCCGGVCMVLGRCRYFFVVVYVVCCGGVCNVLWWCM